MSIMDRQTDRQTDRQHNTCIQCAVPHKRHLHQLTEVNKESSVSLPLVLRKCHYARQVVLLSTELLLHSRMQATHACYINTESKYERWQHDSNTHVDGLSQKSQPLCNNKIANFTGYRYRACALEINVDLHRLIWKRGC